MRGRLLNIKKTTLLRLSFILNLILYVIVTALCYKNFEEENLYFFLFCIFVGIHLLLKSMLFRLDSSCYFGNLLLGIGAFYLYCWWLDILFIYTVFIMLVFAFSSFTNYCYFSQPLHLYLSFSCLFVAIGLGLYHIKLISLLFFLAIVVGSMLLLVVRFLTMK